MDETAPQLIGKEIVWEDIERIQSFGQGTLSIGRLKLSPTVQGGPPDILKMDFRCVLSRGNSFYALPQGSRHPVRKIFVLLLRTGVLVLRHGSNG